MKQSKSPSFETVLGVALGLFLLVVTRSALLRWLDGVGPGATARWAIAAALLLLFVAALLWAFPRRRPAVAGAACGRCGYDLRQTIARCPECGTPLPPRNSVTATRPARGQVGPG